jgi:NAD-dependent SIR2 family protein deacetylase
MLASEIWPGRHLPTLTHAFLKVLDDKGLLLRNYTQNIDGLEVIAGVKEEVRLLCTSVHTDAL